MKNDCFIHIHGGKLYGMRTTSHVLWAIDILLNGLKPSQANPSLTLRCSNANVGFKESNLFQDKALQKNLHLETDNSVSNPSRNIILGGLETEFSVLKTLVCDFDRL